MNFQHTLIGVLGLLMAVFLGVMFSESAANYIASTFGSI